MRACAGLAAGNAASQGRHAVPDPMLVVVITSKLTADRLPGVEAMLRPLLERGWTRRDIVCDDLAIPPDSVTRTPTGTDLDNFAHHPLHSRQVLNAFAHRRALEIAAAETSPTLVIEDDAIPGEDYMRDLGLALTRGVGLVSLGLPGREPGMRAVGAEVRALPCCESYLVWPEAARALSEAFLPIRFRTNIHLTHLIRATAIDHSQVYPNAFCDGSKVGTHVSVMPGGTPILFNAEYIAAQSAVARGEMPPEPPAGVEQHPEMIATMARAKAAAAARAETSGAGAEGRESAIRLRGEARALFDRALSVLRLRGALVDGSLAVLRDAIALEAEG